VQLSITGKGGKVRQVLLPAIVAEANIVECALIEFSQQANGRPLAAAKLIALPHQRDDRPNIAS
jgi:hypothetical protein